MVVGCFGSFAFVLDVNARRVEAGWLVVALMWKISRHRDRFGCTITT